MGFCGKSGFLTFAGLNDTTSRQLIKKVHNSRKGKKRVCENSILYGKKGTLSIAFLPNRRLHSVIQRFILCPGNALPFRIHKTLIRCLDLFILLVCLVSTDHSVLSFRKVQDNRFIKIGMRHALLVGNKRDEPFSSAPASTYSFSACFFPQNTRR